MRYLLLLAIRIYQRYLSPHKGFCCAYRAHTGRASCSTLGYRAIRRYGGLIGIAILRRRMTLCSVMQQQNPPKHPPFRYQRGDCDLPCDSPLDWIDVCNCGSCDWPKPKHKRRKKATIKFISHQNAVSRANVCFQDLSWTSMKTGDES